jgi:hypothetical protein
MGARWRRSRPGPLGLPGRAVFQSALTKCYTVGSVRDDLVIFVKCRSVAEKLAFASAAED